jgi:hypothetical protein
MTVEKIKEKFDVHQFAKEIECLVAHNNISYLDALLLFADANDLEPEAVGPMVKKCQPILQKLEAESRKVHILHNSASESSLESFL